MRIFDIVQIVGRNYTFHSYPPNSRTLIEFHEDRVAAEDRCRLYNDKRAETMDNHGHHFEVEEHDEESATRANPIK